MVACVIQYLLEHFSNICKLMLNGRTFFQPWNAVKDSVKFSLGKKQNDWLLYHFQFAISIKHGNRIYLRRSYVGYDMSKAESWQIYYSTSSTLNALFIDLLQHNVMSYMYLLMFSFVFLKT